MYANITQSPTATPTRTQCKNELDIFTMCNCVHVNNFEVPCIVLGVQESVDTDVSVHGSGCGLHGDLHGTAVSSPHVHRMCSHGKGNRWPGSNLFQGHCFTHLFLFGFAFFCWIVICEFLLIKYAIIKYQPLFEYIFRFIFRFIAWYFLLESYTGIRVWMVRQQEVSGPK